MTKKDYIRAVTVINDRVESLRWDRDRRRALANTFADFFEQEPGTKFDRDKFMTACKV